MPKNIRVRTEVGVDRNIRVNIDQDFDFLEILSLKLKQEDVYSRFCADYGVVTGRVVANGGFGVPNANVSIFVPIDSIDENDPVISTLYPYKTPNDKNEDGYRYNLLPHIKENFAHIPTGTFPSREDVLTRKEVLQIYEKYYKFTVKTNSSGDFMIVGVPLGQQKVVLDLDLSNIGEFSLRPADLIRMGKAVETEFDGQFFKSSENLDALPQIVHDVVDIDVSSFWGDSETCDVGITRVDFDLRELGYEINPTAIFMGSTFSTNESDFLKSNCKIKPNAGNLCDLVTGPGQILCIRQTIDIDENGDPILEQYSLENNGNLIDENGAWMVDLPMNLDYLTTNEFGETVISNDPTVGIPSKAKYRFKIKWQSDGGLKKPVLRANYLIPNIKEHWTSPNFRPQNEFANKSYAFSLDWNDYYDKDSAITCLDTFYKFSYNKVYTVSSHIDRFKWGRNRARHLGIKEIDDRACQSEISKLPINDGVRNFDLIFFLFNILLRLISPAIIVIIPLVHVLAWLWPFLRLVLNVIISIINGIRKAICVIKKIRWPNLVGGGLIFPNLAPDIDCENPELEKIPDENPFSGLKLPMIIYPDCEACNCTEGALPTDPNMFPQLEIEYISIVNVSSVSDFNSINAYSGYTCGNPDPELLGEANPSTGILYGYDPDTDENTDARNMAFAGNNIANDIFQAPNIGRPASFSRWFNSPVYPVSQWGWAPATNADGEEEVCALFKKTWRVAPNPTFPQNLNLLNQRARYFKHPTNAQNIIQGKLKNAEYYFNDDSDQVGIPGGPGSLINQPWTDMPLLLITDENVTYNSGQLISFQNPVNENQVDRNLNYYSGGTNGFGRNGKTANTINNQTSLFERTFNYINEDGNEETCTVAFFNTATTTDYKFTAGVEYFQVITGFTLQECLDNITYLSQTNGTNLNSSIIYNYIFNYRNTITCAGNNAMPTEWVSDPCTFAGPLINWSISGTYYEEQRYIKDHFPDFYTQKLYILTRGVDPHSPRQKIEFNLTRLFGSNDGNFYNQDPFKVEGDFYMNIPIQKHNWGHISIIDYRSPIALYDFGYDLGPRRFITNNVASGGDGDIENNPTAAGNGCFHKSFTIDILSLMTPNPNNNNQPGPLTTSGFTNYSSLDRQMAVQLSENFSTYDCNPDTEYSGIATNGYNSSVKPGYQGEGDINNISYWTSYNKIRGQQGTSDPSNANYHKRVEGASLQFAKTSTNDAVQPFGVASCRSDVGTISPSYYYFDYIPNTGVYNLRVFRTDRLPVSDAIFLSSDGTTRYDQRYCFYMNPNFRVYNIDDSGNVTSTTGGAEGSVQGESTGNFADMADELPETINALTESFTCEGLTSLKCYGGNGEDFTLLDPCVIDDFNWGERVENGCYVFVLPKFLKTIGKDFKLFFEYRSRLILMFAMCRGILSQVFQNNWLNGSLYLPSFQKRDLYDEDNQVIGYKYCGYSLPYDGPLYFNTETNSFFYRSTPYYNGEFIGQSPSTEYAGANSKNIWFPTTIMDLGPRESLLKEVIFSPEFETFILDKLQTTSYQEVSDIINLFLLSRLVSANFLELVLQSGDASINGLFSRDPGGALSFQENRVDGDLAQLFSINSEYGVLPYFGGNYTDSVTVQDDRLGIWFDSDLIDRKELNPGITTFGNDPETSPTNFFGYPGSQIVPYYRWKIESDNGLFGTELNTWYTDEIYSTNYQNAPHNSSGYMVPQYGPAYGHIFNQSSNDPELDQLPPGGTKIKVGSPYHFYFGLKIGKTALNKFLSKYLFLDV